MAFFCFGTSLTAKVLFVLFYVGNSLGQRFLSTMIPLEMGLIYLFFQAST